MSIETWKKDNVTILFAVEGGVIKNKLGTVKGFTIEELTRNGWKRVDEYGNIVNKKVDIEEEVWEDVDMSEPELIDDSIIEEI